MILVPLPQVKEESENLGEILAGDRIESSDYVLIFGKNETCKVLCWKEYGRRATNDFVERIKQDYTVNW